jgi:hypothetical protein
MKFDTDFTNFHKFYSNTNLCEFVKSVFRFYDNELVKIIDINPKAI